MTAPIYYAYPFAVSGNNRNPVNQTYQNDNVISYQDGWTPSYELNLAVSGSGAIPMNRGQTNQLFYDATSNIQQYQQQGVPFWYANNGLPNPDTALIQYPLYARVVYTDGNVYESQITNNTNTPGTDGTWLCISAGTVQPGTVITYAGASVLAGYLNCDGSTVSQATYPALYRAIGNTWGTAGAGLFKLPNQQGFTIAGAGGSLFASPDTVGLTGGAATTTGIISHTHVASITSGTTNPTPSADGNNMVVSQTSGTPHAGSIAIATPAGSVSSLTNIQPTNIMMMLIKY